MSKIKGKRFKQWVVRTIVKVKGRKDYVCAECQKTIAKGVCHYKYSTFPGVERVHENCIEVIV